MSGKNGVLQVKMLGAFTLAAGEVSIGDGGSRSRNIWRLLAYLVYHRSRTVSQEELIRLLWGGEEEGENQAGALKTAFWRARKLLEALPMGKSLIQNRGGGYQWNLEIPMELDIEIFEKCCRSCREAEDEDARLDSGREALGLYAGDFLGKLSTDPWVAPISMYYHNLYVHTLLECLPLLLERGYYEEMEGLCRRALTVEPYHEGLHQYLIRSLAAREEYEKAVQAYEALRETLQADLGILPGEASQELFREVSRHISGYATPVDTVRQQLQEENPTAGALVCDYTLFKCFCQAEARAMARRGDAVHIGMLSVTNASGGELPKRSLDRAMENLRVQIGRSLRRSDIASQCSASQFLVLLLQCNYENSCMVCERIIRAFFRAYPHSPARISYTVFPLEPLESRARQ